MNEYTILKGFIILIFLLFIYVMFKVFKDPKEFKK